MSWTEPELAALANTYFRTGNSKCPRDNTPLRAEKMQFLGRKTADLFLRCPRCGSSATWENEEPPGEQRTWPASDRSRIVDGYWQRRHAECPVDNAILEIQESTQLGQEVTALIVRCPRCGRYFASDEPVSEEPPETEPFFARYEVIRPIGKGGMATVELVRDRKTGDQFAAKTIAPERARERGFMERFQREISILRGLSHPNVVQIVDEFVGSGRATYVMEFLAGGDLAAAIRDPRHDPLELARYFSDASAGVAYLHESRFIHRDLNPRNILIGADGRARVSDFGLAIPAERDDAVTVTGEFLGTMPFSAPEQVRGARDVSAKADIYSLGLIAICVLSRKLESRDPYSWTVGNDALARTLASALNPDPARRTVTPQELARAVRGRAERDVAVTAQAGAQIAVGDKFTQLDSVPDDDRVDEHLATLGFRRVGKGRPRAGQLYLGRGGPMSDGRGIYRRETDDLSGEGFSGADFFELLERI